MKYVLFDTTVDLPIISFGNGTVEVFGSGKPLLFGDISELIRTLRRQPAVLHHNQDRLTIRRATETTTVTYDEEVS